MLGFRWILDKADAHRLRSYLDDEDKRAARLRCESNEGGVA